MKKKFVSNLTDISFKRIKALNFSFMLKTIVEKIENEEEMKISV